MDKKTCVHFYAFCHKNLERPKQKKIYRERENKKRALALVFLVPSYMNYVKKLLSIATVLYRLHCFFYKEIRASFSNKNIKVVKGGLI